MNPSERNYAAHELELLAIVDTIRAWRSYLYGRKFTIFSDHHPLRYLQTQSHLSPRQVRWVERLVDFDFQFVPLKGKSNRVADALSRQTQETAPKDEYGKEVLGDLLRRTTFQTNSISTVATDPSLVGTLAHCYKEDPEFNGTYENPRTPFTKEDELLYFKGRLCIPKGSIRNNLLHDNHATPIAGHLGVNKTYLRIRPHYYWKGMRQTIEEFVNACVICQSTKAPNHKPFGLLQPLDPPKSKWTHITMDFIIPLPETPRKNVGILNVVDRLSKMIRLIPVPPNADAFCIAKLFRDHIYRHHGLPQVIVSDRDSIFMSKFWKSLFQLLGTKLSPSSAYHPQTDGQTEIVNRKVEEMIRAFANYDKSNWDENLVDFEVAYNSSVHSTTMFTPFFLNYGIHPRTIPLQTLSSDNPSATSFLTAIQKSVKYAQENIRKSNESAAKYANRRRIPHKFAVGDLVWLSTKNLSLEDGSGNRKLHPKFCGPFEITAKVNEVTIRLNLSQSMKDRRIHNAFHVSLLRPFVKDEFNRTPPPPPPLQFEDSHKEFEVESIVAQRKHRGKTQYLVKWKGYPDHENTWLCTQDLENCQEILQEFIASRRCSN